MLKNETKVAQWCNANCGDGYELKIWGTGSSATAFIDSYPFLKITGFVETTPRSSEFKGLPCVSPDQIDTKRTCVIVASEFYEDICSQLEKMKIPQQRSAISSELMIEDSDCCLISYQKCGRTWLRTLIGRTCQLTEGFTESDILKITESGAFFKNLYPSMPNIVPHHDDNAHRKQEFELSKDKSFYTGKKIIFLHRDPRDVVVSNYYHMRFRAKNFFGSIEEFIDKYFSGIIRFYNIWAEQPNEILYISYEDLQKDTYKYLKMVFNFVDKSYQVNEEDIIEAVNYSSFMNMKEYEKQNRFNSSTLSSKDEDQRSYKVRKGKVGSYLDEIPATKLSFCDETISKYLNKRYDY